MMYCPAKLINTLFWEVLMTSKEMINLIIDVERNQHGINKLYPSRIRYFQTTNNYDKHTFEVTYDEAFEKMIADFEIALGCKLYRPTAKKILNNWYAWALEQRIALLRLSKRCQRIYVC